jgi:hypothetical protein
MIAALAALASCATLGNLIQPPTFASEPGRQSELRLLGPSPTRPLGGAGVRLWARISNPNAFALTLSRLSGDLLLEEGRAATVDLPLGVPLVAQGSSVVPIDIDISFADVPGLSAALQRAVAGQPVQYRLRGNVTVDAGALGQPSFGPATLLTGDLRVLR